MKNKLFMITKNITNGKMERFYYMGGRTIQEHNQIIINWYTSIGKFD